MASEHTSARLRGVLSVVEATPNPAGGVDRLFLFSGDANAPIERIDGHDLIPERNARAARLRIFHFNDLHNHITDLSGPTKGTRRFAQMVGRVAHARRDAGDDTAVLFLSIGDDHTGSVFDELLGWNADEFVADAGYRLYSAAGIDCSVLGNHEFDRGSALLAMGIRQDARFPILSANVHASAHLVPGQDYHPAAIAISKGLRIGLIGLTTQVETRVGQPGDPTLAVAGPASAMTNLVSAIEPLVDVLLVLSHCGYGDGEHMSGKAAADRDLGEADLSLARAAAPLTSKPLLVIGAHTHTTLNTKGLKRKSFVDGVPIFQAGSNGRYLGEIEVEPDGATDRGVTKARLHEIRNTETFAVEFEDSAFEAAHVAPLIAQVGGLLRDPIAHVETSALSFRKAAVERYAGGCALLHFMCDAIVARLTEAGFEVDFALLNGASVLAGIEPGPLTLGAWFDVMPYPDEVQIVEMTEEDLHAVLQSNARRILRPDEMAKIDAGGFLPRGFMHGSKQLRCRIELGRSAAEAACRAIEVHGRPINAGGRRFRVAMPAYLALGAFGERWNGRPLTGGVPGGLAGYDLRVLPRQDCGRIFRNEIAEFIKSAGVIDDRTVSQDGRCVVDAGLQQAS